MTARRTRTDLATASALLERQWRTLRAWLGRVLGERSWSEGLPDAPTVLPGVSVVDLVDHVGRTLDALVVAEPADPGVLPLTLAEYFAAYRDDPEEIARSGAATAGHASLPLAPIDRMAAAAFARLRVLGPADRVVTTRRAAITLSDLTLSRTIELVVHGDDLARSVPRVVLDPPLDPDALRVTAEALLGIVVARGGWSLELVDPLLWVRVAAGRHAGDGPTNQLADALRARFTSDSVPDLGRMLPLI